MNCKSLSLAALTLSGVLTMALALPIVPAFSQTHYSMGSYLRCTREQNIMEAFNLMEGGKGGTSLDKIVNKPMRVIFKDMKSLNKSLANYDALSWISAQGEQVIFINEKHRGAPPEALAAMISHEAMHDDEFNSVSEEVQGWGREAQVWIELKAAHPELAKIQAGAYPLVDRENRIEAEYRKGTLEAFVKNNPGYKGLPEISPGFGPETAGTAPDPLPVRAADTAIRE